MIEAATIAITADFDSGGVQRGTVQAAAAVTTFERTVSQSLARVQTAFGTLSRSQVTLGALALGAGLVGTALAATVRPAIEFEQAFAGVRKTVDATPAQLDSIRTGLIDMSRVMPVAATELAGIAESAGQLGVAAPDVLAFTETVAKLAATTDLSYDDAATSLARFVNITDAGIGDVETLGSVLVALGNNMATTESEALSLSLRMGAAFTTADVSAPVILALAGAYKSLGVNAEAGGTALSRTITAIRDAALIGGTELQVFADTAGLTVEEFRKLALSQDGAAEAMLLFQAGLGQLGEQGLSVTPVLDAVGLSSIRIKDTLERGAGATTQFEDALSLMGAELTNATALTDEYGRATETTASRIETFQNRLNAIAISLGTPLLDTFATSVDLAGDAIERLVELAGPVGAELVESFLNLGDVVGLFYQVLGSPVLEIALAAFAGLLVAVEGVLKVFNSLGPIGVVAGAALLLIATNSQGAAGAALLLSINLQAVGVSGTIAAAGAAAFQAALAVGPLVAFVGVMALVGKAFIDADRSAKAAAESFRTAITEAIDAGDVAQAEREIGKLRDRMEELRGQAGGVTDGWGAFGRALLGTGQILTPFTENTVFNATKELEALEGAVESEGWLSMADNVRRAADALGLSEDATVALASEMGVLLDVTTTQGKALFEVIKSMAQYANEAGVAAGAAGSFNDMVNNNVATLSDYAAELGLTERQLEAVASRIEDVDTSDLLDDELTTRWAAFNAITAELETTMAEMGAAVGITGAEMAEQVAITNDLAAAHNRLQEAVQAALSTMAQLGEQQRITAEASDAFDESLTAIGDNDGLENAARALNVYLTNLAASGVSLDEFTAAQDAAVQSMIAAGEQAGANSEDVLGYIATLGLVPPDILTELIVLGEDAELTVEEHNARMDEILREVLVRLGVIDEATPKVAEFFLKINDVETVREATITANTADAQTNVDQLDESIDGLEDKAVTVTAETGEAEANVQSFFDRINEVPEVTLTTFEADDQASPAAEAVLTKAQEIAREFLATLIAEDQATPTIDRVTPGLTGFAAPWIAFLLAQDDASPTIGSTTAAAEGYASGTYDGSLTASDNASPTIIGLQALAAGYAAATYTAPFSADTAGAIAGIGALTVLAAGYSQGDYTASLNAADNASPTIIGTQALAVAYAAGAYVAALTATDVASPTIRSTQAAAQAYAAARYDASLTATDRASGVIRSAQSAAQAFARTYNAVLTAVDRASSVIRGAVGALGGFQSRSITVTTNHVTRHTTVGSGSSSTQRATGGIDFGNVQVFEDGGFSGRRPQPILEPAGFAQVYPPASPGRLHSELVTGGEAYIPLGEANRRRSLDIWKLAGRYLDAFDTNGVAYMFNQGGLSSTVGRPPAPSTSTFGTQITIAAPISMSVDASGSNMSTDEISSAVERGVNAGIRRAAKKLSNTRI